MALSEGLYDQLIAAGPGQLLAAREPSHANARELKGRIAEPLADLVARQIGAILASLPGDDQERAQAQLEPVSGREVQLRQLLLQRPTPQTEPATSHGGPVAPPARAALAGTHAMTTKAELEGMTIESLPMTLDCYTSARNGLRGE